MINILFTIASVVTVIGAIITAINFITKKRKVCSERGKSKRAAKNILDSYRRNNSK